MAIRIVATHGLNTTEADLDKDSITIGRHADFNLPDALVSTQHLRIRKIGEHLYVKDLSSANGTFFNDQKLESEMLLLHGDKLLIGKTELKAWPQFEFKEIQEEEKTIVKQIHEASQKLPPLPKEKFTVDPSQEIKPFEVDMASIEASLAITKSEYNDLKSSADMDFEISSSFNKDHLGTNTDSHHVKEMNRSENTGSNIAQEEKRSLNVPPALPGRKALQKEQTNFYSTTTSFLFFRKLFAGLVDFSLYLSITGAGSYYYLTRQMEINVDRNDLEGLINTVISFGLWKGILLSAVIAQITVFLAPALLFKRTFGMLIFFLKFNSTNAWQLLLRETAGRMIYLLLGGSLFVTAIFSKKRRHLLDWLTSSSVDGVQRSNKNLKKEPKQKNNNETSDIKEEVTVKTKLPQLSE